MIAAIIACVVVVVWLLMLVALSGDNRVVIPRTVAEALTRAARAATVALNDLALAFAKLAPAAKRMNEQLERAFGRQT